MLFSIAYAIQSHKENKERDRHRNAERKAREDYRTERAVGESERNLRRIEREMLIEMLKAEQARNHALTARVLELTDLVINQSDGRNTNRNADNVRGE